MSSFVLTVVAALCFAGHILHAQSSITFTNPTAFSPSFGAALAIVAPDRFLVGDLGNSNGFGSIFLFNTNGTLIQSFHNPAPALGRAFGQSIAMVGSNHFIAAASSTSGFNGREPGAAHLFHLDGTLVRTFSDPTPSPGGFGLGTALGHDRVLIGAVKDNVRRSRIYLFNTNGTLLNTITNPEPEGNFRSLSILVTKPDRIFIGSETFDAIGAVYLFNTNGALLKAIRPPNPSGFEEFGYSMARLNGNRIVVGAPGRDRFGEIGVGAIYILSEEGVFERMIQFSAANGAYFGHAVATLENRVVVGAPFENQAHLIEHCDQPIKSFLNLEGTFGSPVAVIGNGNHVLVSGMGSAGHGLVVLYFGGGDRFLSTLVESDFTSGLDGWTSSAQTATHDAANGTVFVHEQADDGATNYWRAPAKFLGNKSPAYNGQLRFEQKTSQPASTFDGLIILRGNGMSLVRSVPPPGRNFTSYDILLSATGWRINDASGPEPTELQFMGVMSDLTALEIRAELSATKPETNTLDNVRLLQPSRLCDIIVRAHRDPAGTRVEWPANVSASFNLFGSTNLAGTNWTIVPSTPTQTNGLNSVLESNTDAATFFQLRR